MLLAAISLAGPAAPAMAAAAVAGGPEPETSRRTDRDRPPKRDRSSANPQQFDAERLKLASDGGTFLVFETPYDANHGVDPSDLVASDSARAEPPAVPTGFLAYWNGGDAGGVYVYNRMIHTVADVGDALRALEKEFGVDLPALAANNDRAAMALELAAWRPEPAATAWLRSSREQVMYITGLWSPDDFEHEELDQPVAGAGTVAMDPDHEGPCVACARGVGGGDSPTDPYLDAMIIACECDCGGTDMAPIECSDNNPCTTSYLESDGCTVKCIHRPKRCPCNVCATDCRCNPATGQCTNKPRDCNDGNECTTDRCSTVAVPPCQRIPLSDGTPCLDEGDPCLLNVCMRDASGTTSECTHPLKCPDRLCCNGTCCTNPCANDCCIQPDNSLTCCYGECMGSTCCPTIVCDGQCCPGSLNSCTEYPLCVNGQCVLGSPPCDDGDPCTEDRCTSGDCEAVCEHVPEGANGESCDEEDDDPCTVGECENGTCQPVPGNHGAVCPDTDENACTVGECQGGICTPIDDENGGVCEDADGNPCTVGSCSNGVCVPGPGNEGGLCADDGNPCTNNVCASGICTYPCKAVCSSTCITSAGAPGWCINCACAPETCEISVSDGMSCPGGTAEVTVSGTCGPSCITYMNWTIDSPSPHISGDNGTLLCAGKSVPGQLDIAAGAPLGSIPITITGTTQNGVHCFHQAALEIAGAQWSAVTSTPFGLIVLCNVDDDDGNGMIDKNGGDVAPGEDDLAQATLPGMPFLAPGWSVRLRLSDEENIEAGKTEVDVVRVFPSLAPAISAILGPGLASEFPLPEDDPVHGVDLAALRTGPVPVFIEGLEFAGAVRLAFIVTDPNGNECADELPIKVAPLLLLSHLDPAEVSYVSRIFGTPATDSESAAYTTQRFRNATPAPIVDVVISHPDNDGDDQWAQDQFQIGYQSATYNDMYVVINSKRIGGLSAFPPTLLGPDFGYVKIDNGVADTTFDAFGNLEVAPACAAVSSTYPLGRIYLGYNQSNPDPDTQMDGKFREFLSRQGLQPIVALDTDWLLVGHVDEFMCIVQNPLATHGWSVLFADSAMAIEILKGNALVAGGVSESFHIPQYADKGLVQLGALLGMGVSCGGAADVESYNSTGGPVHIALENLRAQIAQAFGLVQSNDIYSIPVLFACENGKATAVVPNLVNAAVYGNTLIAPRQFLHALVEEDANLNFRLDAGEDGNANGMLDTLRDPFELWLTQNLPSGLTASYIDDWYLYHNGHGEVHCSSNERRAIPASPLWWEVVP